MGFGGCGPGGLRQVSEQNRCRPTGRKVRQQTGQVLAAVVVLSSTDGGSACMTDGFAEVGGAGLVGSQAVAVTVEVHDDAAIEEPVEHGGGDRLIAEDLTPAADRSVGVSTIDTSPCWSVSSSASAIMDAAWEAR